MGLMRNIAKVESLTRLLTQVVLTSYLCNLRNLWISPSLWNPRLQKMRPRA